MSVHDRIVAACCGDLEQAELVEQMMGRLVGRQSGTDGSLPSLAHAEPLCERCGHEVDDAFYCFECGHTNPIKEQP